MLTTMCHAFDLTSFTRKAPENSIHAEGGEGGPTVDISSSDRAAASSGGAAARAGPVSCIAKGSARRFSKPKAVRTSKSNVNRDTNS